MNSMTGYGDATVRTSEFAVHIRISSVNRKHFDVRLTMARDLAFLEPDVRSRLAAEVQRGHLTLAADLKLAPDASSATPVLNMPLARAYLREIERLRSGCNLAGHVEITDIINLPDVIGVTAREFSEDDLRAPAMEALTAALAEYQAMRAQEGETLRTDLAMRRELVATHLEAIRELAPSQPDAYRERLRQRLHDLVDGLAIDADRVAKEVAIYAERCDITEEIIRLGSHLDQLAALLDATEPVGRKLDFLMQEVNREINTIGSKSVHREINQRVIDMKTELDRMREQAQNIE